MVKLKLSFSFPQQRDFIELCRTTLGINLAFDSFLAAVDGSNGGGCGS